MGQVCHVVQSIWVSFLIFDVPQNGSVSESLTHTSGHRLVKSAPRGLVLSLQRFTLGPRWLLDNNLLVSVTGNVHFGGLDQH